MIAKASSICNIHVNVTNTGIYSTQRKTDATVRGWKSRKKRLQASDAHDEPYAPKKS